MKRGRGDLFREVLAALAPGVVLSTRQIADAVPDASRQLVGIVLRRATLRIEVLPTFEPAPTTVRRAFHGGNFL